MSTLEIQAPERLKCSFFLPMDLWELAGQALFILLVISFLNAASFALSEPLRFRIDDCIIVNGREHSPGCIHFGVHWLDTRKWEWALKTQVSFIKEKWAYHCLFWVKYSAEWGQPRHVAYPGAWRCWLYSTQRGDALWLPLPHQWSRRWARWPGSCSGWLFPQRAAFAEKVSVFFLLHRGLNLKIPEPQLSTLSCKLQSKWQGLLIIVQDVRP